MIHYRFSLMPLMLLLYIACISLSLPLSWYHCSIFYTDKYKSRNNNGYDAADKYLDQIAESLTDHSERGWSTHLSMCVCECVSRESRTGSVHIYVIIIITIINYRMRCSLISFQSSFLTLDLSRLQVCLLLYKHSHKFWFATRTFSKSISFSLFITNHPACPIALTALISKWRCVENSLEFHWIIVIS